MAVSAWRDDVTAWRNDVTAWRYSHVPTRVPHGSTFTLSVSGASTFDLGLRRRWAASATHRAASYEKVRIRLDRLPDGGAGFEVALLAKGIDLAGGNPDL